MACSGVSIRNCVTQILTGKRALAFLETQNRTKVTKRTQVRVQMPTQQLKQRLDPSLSPKRYLEALWHLHDTQQLNDPSNHMALNSN